MEQLADPVGEETPLEAGRLSLEPLLPEHARLLYQDLTDGRLYRFIPTNAPEPVEALENRYRKLSSRISPDGSETWLNFVMRLRQDGARAQAIYVGTLEATVYPDRSAYIAYTVFVLFWRGLREGGLHAPAETSGRGPRHAGRDGGDGHA